MSTVTRAGRLERLNELVFPADEQVRQLRRPVFAHGIFAEYVLVDRALGAAVAYYRDLDEAEAELFRREFAAA